MPFDFITIQKQKLELVLKLLNDITIKNIRIRTINPSLIIPMCNKRLNEIKEFLLNTIISIDNLKSETFYGLLHSISENLNIIKLIIQLLNEFNNHCVNLDSKIFDNLNSFVNYSNLFIEISKLIIPSHNISLREKQDNAANIIQDFFKSNFLKNKEKKAISIIQAYIRRSQENPDIMAKNLVYETTNQILYELEGLNKARNILSKMPPSRTIAEKMHTSRKPSKQTTPKSTPQDIYKKKIEGYKIETNLQTGNSNNII
jgi:hypothetical protein